MSRNHLTNKKKFNNSCLTSKNKWKPYLSKRPQNSQIRIVTLIQIRSFHDPKLVLVHLQLHHVRTLFRTNHFQNQLALYLLLLGKESIHLTSHVCSTFYQEVKLPVLSCLLPHPRFYSKSINCHFSVRKCL